MSTIAPSPALVASVSPSRPARYGGRIISGFCITFLTFDLVLKFFKPQVVVEGTGKLGYSESVIYPLAIVLFVCTLLYTIPRTAILGAILLTGYLGGAVASHTRVGDPLLSHTLFPVYLGVLLWLGLYLRLPAVRALIPVRR